MIKCIIVDDEPLAQDVLEEHISKVSDFELVKKFNNAPAAQKFLETNDVDLILLDIEMPEMTGIHFLKTLSKPPLTIFTTAYRNYAFEGFELGVIDFLLKPISFPRFSTAMEKVKEFLSLKTQDTQLEQSESAPEFIFVKSGVKRIKLFFDHVTHIQGLKDYAIIYTPQEKIVIKGSIKMVQDMFPSTLFVRVHKSFLVSSKAIKRIERNRIVIENYQIPIGRNYRENMETSIKTR
jgi:DNA-binding LytR/AlgR family response regulator